MRFAGFQKKGAGWAGSGPPDSGTSSTVNIGPASSAASFTLLQSANVCSGPGRSLVARRASFSFQFSFFASFHFVCYTFFSCDAFFSITFHGITAVFAQYCMVRGVAVVELVKPPRTAPTLLFFWRCSGGCTADSSAAGDGEDCCAQLGAQAASLRML